MKYLIIKCDELCDQYECDANRIPITMTDNWMEWYEKTRPDYCFEVYEFKNNEFILVKDYETSMEQGMVFVMCNDDNENEFTIIEKFPNFDRNKSMPKTLHKRALKGEDLDDSLRNCGYVSWFEKGILYAYTEYYDNRINTPY